MGLYRNFTLAFTYFVRKPYKTLNGSPLCTCLEIKKNSGCTLCYLIHTIQQEPDFTLTAVQANPVYRNRPLFEKCFLSLCFTILNVKARNCIYL